MSQANTLDEPRHPLIEVSASSQEGEQSYICVVEVSVVPLSTIHRLDLLTDTEVIFNFHCINQVVRKPSLIISEFPHGKYKISCKQNAQNFHKNDFQLVKVKCSCLQENLHNLVKTYILLSDCGQVFGYFLVGVSDKLHHIKLYRVPRYVWN